MSPKGRKVPGGGVVLVLLALGCIRPPVEVTHDDAGSIDAGALDAGTSVPDSGPIDLDGGQCYVGPVLPGPADAGYPPDGGACPDHSVLMPDEGREHLSLDAGDYPYMSQPPSSGPHSPFLAPWGISTTPVGRIHYVHNEEHGGIILVYNCPCGCPDVIQAFTDLYNATPLDQWDEVKIVITPDPEYDGGAFAAAAWDHVYTPDVLDPGALRCFIDTYIDKGPEIAP
jgi:hypothetical protein